jgi:ribose 5-phosphate isomerase A
LGGALLREKIVAEAARRFVVVADASKVVARLGEHSPVPVEVVRFGHEITARRLAGIAGNPVLRSGPDGAPLATDNGNLIYDCHTGPLADAAALGTALHRIAGVVESGLFLEGVEQAIIGGPDGSVRVLPRAL